MALAKGLTHVLILLKLPDRKLIFEFYALSLLKFREVGVEVVLKDFQKRWDQQSHAFSNLFGQADRVDKLAAMIEWLEKGVRILESERAFQRVATVQRTIGNAVVAGTLVNLATILYLHSIRGATGNM